MTIFARPRAGLPDLTVRDVESLIWHHLETTEDQGFAVTDGTAKVKGGLTNWQCIHKRQILSLLWDWMRSDDGVIVLDTSRPLRANFRVMAGAAGEVSIDVTNEYSLALTKTLGWESYAKPHSGSRSAYQKTIPAPLRF